MIEHRVVLKEDWLKKRREILKKEKEITRLKDQLSIERRGLPWIKSRKTTCSTV